MCACVCLFSVKVMVCGYHKYQDVCYARVGETLRCEREVDIVHDTFVVLVKDSEIVTSPSSLLMLPCTSCNHFNYSLLLA